MSTQAVTEEKHAGPDKPANKATTEKTPPDKLVKCPHCGALFHESELVSPPYDEFPRMVFKTPEVKKKPEEVEEPPVIKTVASDDELKKALGDGWAKDPPKPEGAEKPDDNVKADPHGHENAKADPHGHAVKPPEAQHKAK